jgi:hypothetical protein
VSSGRRPSERVKTPEVIGHPVPTGERLAHH